VDFLEKGKVVILEDRIPKLKEQRKQKANRRLIFYLSIFFLLLLCVIYFQSPLSNVSSITIEGNRNVATAEIKKISGISTRTSFWKIHNDSLEKKLEEHIEIKNAEVHKVFPNKIVIEIEERKRVAYILKNEKFIPILENGMLLTKKHENVVPADAPILVHWKKAEDIQEMAKELKKLPSSIKNSISEIHHTPEPNDPLHITLFMNDGFEVSATIRNFSKKMLAYPSIVSKLDPTVKGVIHLEVGAYFKAYEQKGDGKSESEG
jgi:cell division protein FtsQ